MLTEKDEAFFCSTSVQPAYAVKILHRQNGFIRMFDADISVQIDLFQLDVHPKRNARPPPRMRLFLRKSGLQPIR